MAKARRILLAMASAPVVATGTAVGALFLTGTHRRLGVTRDEAESTLPGDDLLPWARI